MSRDLIKILIADDHELFRKGFISLLLNEEGIQIIGEANNGKDLIYKYLKLKPDLIITDIAMPEISGLEAIKTIYETDKSIKVIFLSMFSGEDYVYHCLKAGGSGLINKDISKAELIMTINKVNRGEKYFGAAFNEKDLEQFLQHYEQQTPKQPEADTTSLSVKESEILLLIAEGLTSTEIADSLCISKRTVDTHRIHLMQKLKLRSLPQLIKYAIDYTASIKETDGSEEKY